MEFILIVLGVLFIYLLIVKPEVIAVFFFTITIADINTSISGVPLNIRAIIGLALFARTLIANRNSTSYPIFFAAPTVNIFYIALYTVFISACYDLLTFEFVKISATTLIVAYTGYYFFIKQNNANLLKTSLYLAGLICVADLVYTYAAYGSFPVQRIYMDILKIPVNYDEDGKIIEIINHGFYGLVCGLAFVVILADYLNNKLKYKIFVLLVPMMFLGVLMSTSRSALLGLIGITIFLIGKALQKKESSKKAYSLSMIILSATIISFLVFASLQSFFDLDKNFMDRITLRLIDEPVAVINKQLGLNYNVNSLDAMEWRKEASENAMEAFLNLKFHEQVFGIGYWGFATRKLGHNNLPPHNGILMLLIEFGMAGLVFWSIFIGKCIKRSLKSSPDMSPILLLTIFVFLFSLANNSELTGSTMFLFVSTLIAETIYNSKVNSQIKPPFTLYAATD